LGVPREVYDKLTPVTVALEIQSIQAEMNGGSVSEIGIDYVFMSLAAQSPMPIIELESVRMQVDLLASFSPELQEWLLLGALEESESADVSPETNLAAMLQAWKEGEGIEEFLISEITDELMQEFNNKLYDARNKALIEKVSAFLSNPGTDDYFVTVGTLHMIEERGIVRGLEKLGYTVTRR
jgi:uncharacterized protein YbaP (TraB family)